MRNKFYINRPSTTSILWSVLTQGDLIVAYTEEMAIELQEMIRAKGGTCFSDLMEDDPTRDADDARNSSVEVMTREEHNAIREAQ